MSHSERITQKRYANTLLTMIEEGCVMPKLICPTSATPNRIPFSLRCGRTGHPSNLIRASELREQSSRNHVANQTFLQTKSQDIRRSQRGFSIALVILSLIWQQAIQADEVLPSLPDGLVLKQPNIPDDVTGGLRKLNEKLSRNVAPSENVAVLLTQLFGETVFDLELRDASLEMLGIERLSMTAPRFQYVEAFLKAQGVTDLEELGGQSHLLERQIFAGANHPWKQTDFPELFDYLTANQRALDFLRNAASQPKYYAPMLSAEDPPQILSASVALERRLPFVVQVLCARALLRIANQKETDAVDDLMTCHKLAVLLATGSPFDVSGSKAYLMHSMANHAAFSALANHQVTPLQAKYYLGQLKRIPQLPSASIASDQGERAILHQELEFLQTSPLSVREFFDLPDDQPFQSLERIRMSDLPWDQAEKRADEVHDRFVKAISLSDRTERKALSDELDQEYRQWTENAEETNRAVATEANGDLVVIARWIGETMAMSLRPLYAQRVLTDESTRMRRDLVSIGMALILARTDNNEFPIALSNLSPTYLETVPVDAHSDKPFGYVRISNNHVRLSSLGANQQDDAGQQFNDDRILEIEWRDKQNPTANDDPK